MTIDAHLHLWVSKPDQYPWNPIGGYIPEKEAPLESFLPLAVKNDIEKAVLVQPTPYGWDNSYMMECKKSQPDFFRTVVLVDPFSENAPEELLRLHAEGADGIRINLHLKSLSEWHTKTFFDLLWTCEKNSIPVCLQMTQDYICFVNGLAEECETVFILDHLARPEPGIKPDDNLFQKLLTAADCPNIFIKLSGLNYFSSETAPYEDTWKLLQAAKEAFTAERCMWGSDFPFVEEHWSYEDNLKTYRESIGFAAEELEWIMGKTAESIWWEGDGEA